MADYCRKENPVNNERNFVTLRSKRSRASEEFLTCWSRESGDESTKSTERGVVGRAPPECGESSFVRTGTLVTLAKTLSELLDLG